MSRVEKAEPRAQIAHCTAGADRFAIDLAGLAGIERTDQLQRTPAAPEGGRAAAEIGWLLGPREDLPVYSLARLLGRPGAERGRRETDVVLVLSGQSGAGSFGVLVDGIERSEVPPEAIHPLPGVFFGSRGHAAFGGVVQSMGALSLLVDLRALVVGGSEVTPGAPDEDPRDGKDLRNGEDGRRPEGGEGGRRASRVLIADLLARSVEGRPVSIALAAGQVAEVLGTPPVLAVPGAPAHLPGMILWRDSPLPVLDLARGLTDAGRLEAFASPAARFVVVAAGSSYVAVPVGREVRFERLPLPARAIPLPPQLAGTEVLGAFDLSGTLLLVFDVRRSLAGADRP